MSGALGDRGLRRGGRLAALACLVALAAFGAPRLIRHPAVAPPAPPPARVIAARALLFQDRADGGIEIADAASGRRVGLIEPRRGGFVRGVMRGLATYRKRRGVGAAVPFRLAALSDGRLTLSDPATATVIDLEAFGPTNEADFARFLGAKEATP